jgi:cobyrinic acid a,c-diamide synthase
MASAAVCSCLSEWQMKEEQIKALQEKAAEAISYHDYEGFLSLMPGMIRRMDNMGKTCKLSLRVK